MSQIELADRVGVSRTYLNAVLNNQAPGSQMLWADIATTLGTGPLVDASPRSVQVEPRVVIVRAAMKDRHMSQHRLATLVGVHPSHISKVLSGGALGGPKLWRAMVDVLQLGDALSDDSMLADDKVRRAARLTVPAGADADALIAWTREHLGITITSSQAETMRAFLNGNPDRGPEQR